MKSKNWKLIGEFIGRILLGLVVGYLVGSLINAVDVFGSSQNAPQLCASGCALIYVFHKMYMMNWIPLKRML